MFPVIYPGVGGAEGLSEGDDTMQNIFTTALSCTCLDLEKKDSSTLPSRREGVN